MAIFSRTGQPREETDREAANAGIHELPSARGCTYVLPRDHFALALILAQGTGDAPDVVTAKKFLGVTEEELESLGEGVLRALEAGPLDPRGIKEVVGDLVRNLGDEGKKRGSTSTLPMVLGRLQTQGFIRRVPQNGRLDQQRFSYKLWKPNPLAEIKMSREEALTELGRLYFTWIGPASQAHFQWFSGLSGKGAKEALAPLSLVRASDGEDLLLLPEDKDAYESFRAPAEPTYNLIGSLDSLLGHRREVASLLDDKDLGRETATDKAAAPISTVLDLYSNAIIDRGRLVGLWEYDTNTSSIVWTSFVDRSTELKKAVSKTEDYIREQLGDCRSFSLDSPESRIPRLNMLRGFAELESVLA